MGSILNFVFPYPKNQIFDWCITGPITTYIESNYKHSYNLEIDDSCKNILVFETVEKFKGFTKNINTKINNQQTVLDYIKENSSLIILVVSIADPAVDYEKQDIIDIVENEKLSDRVFYIESNFQHLGHKNTFCWHFFIEDAAENVSHIFLNEINDLGYKSEEVKLEELDRFRNKKFISLNRTVDRIHRLSLLYDYLQNDFSSSYFSFLVYNSQYESILHFDPDEFDTTYFYQFLPIELDTHNLEDKQNFRTANALGKKEYYLNSCINLVTETSFGQNELFLSEKILKPILNYQPFIVLGPYHYLKELKRLGFKTFSDFWSEEYDEYEDASERYFKTMEVVKFLNSKSIEELNELYQKCKDICIFNRNHFLNIKFSLNEFIKKLEFE